MCIEHITFQQGKKKGKRRMPKIKICYFCGHPSDYRVSLAFLISPSLLDGSVYLKLWSEEAITTEIAVLYSQAQPRARSSPPQQEQGKQNTATTTKYSNGLGLLALQTQMREIKEAEHSFQVPMPNKPLL